MGCIERPEGAAWTFPRAVAPKGRCSLKMHQRRREKADRSENEAHHAKPHRKPQQKAGSSDHLSGCEHDRNLQSSRSGLILVVSRKRLVTPRFGGFRTLR